MVVQVVTDHPMFIDGRSAASSAGAWMEVRSPATGELVGTSPGRDRGGRRRAVAAARARSVTGAGVGWRSPTGSRS